MDQHYHPIIYTRLRQLFEASDWDALVTYLQGLSHSHFRTAGYMIGERLLSDVTPETFWDVFTRLILWHPKAFAVTLSKAAALRFTNGSLSLQDSGFSTLTEALQDDEHMIDREKMLLQWLPVATQPETMEALFTAMGVHQSRRRVDFLLRMDGIPAAFVLLKTLRFEEHDMEYLFSVCRQLIHRASTLSHTMGKADSISFNLASLLRTYFDLPDIRGTFSLNIQPYELSRLDTDFEMFKRFITKV